MLLLNEIGLCDTQTPVRGVRCRCAPVGGLGEGRAVPWSAEEQMNSQEQEGPAMWTSQPARILS